MPTTLQDTVRVREIIVQATLETQLQEESLEIVGLTRVQVDRED